MGVSDETFLISSEKNNIVKDVKLLPSVSSSSTTTTTMHDQDQDQGQNKGQSRNFELVKANLSDEDNDISKIWDTLINGEDDGFNTPTKVENKITVDYSRPPPAPMKPVAKAVKRRRCSDHNKPAVMRRFLEEVSREDIDLLFTPRSVVRKVTKKANLSTLMSFR